MKKLIRYRYPGTGLVYVRESEDPQNPGVLVWTREIRRATKFTHEEAEKHIRAYKWNDASIIAAKGI